MRMARIVLPEGDNHLVSNQVQNRLGKLRRFLGPQLVGKALARYAFSRPSRRAGTATNLSLLLIETSS